MLRESLPLVRVDCVVAAGPQVGEGGVWVLLATPAQRQFLQVRGIALLLRVTLISADDPVGDSPVDDIASMRPRHYCRGD